VITLYSKAMRGASTALVVLVVSACSLGNSSSSSSSSQSSIEIGMEAPLTGRLINTGGGMEQGAELAINAINKAGGVNGRMLHLNIQDDAADPGDAVPAASVLINADHVAAIFGPLSITAGVVLPLAANANIPMLMWGGGAAFDKVTDPHFFRMSPSDTEQGQAMALFAQSKSWTKVALATEADSSDLAIRDAVQPALSHMGISVVANVSFDTGLTSYRSQIQTLFANKPDVVIASFSSVQTSPTVLGEVAQLGLGQTPWIGPNNWENLDWFKSVGQAIATGPIYAVNDSSTGLGGTPEFLKLLQAEYRSSVPRSSAPFVYDGINVWALGADLAGTTNWPKIRDGILKAANGQGTLCGSYADCYSLIKQGKAMKYDGVASGVSFDKYDNVYGPFAAYHFDSSGTPTVVADFSSAQILSAFK
jgi:ABC-type branched-subunit amino acid transport system substrate-binding protein